MLAAFRFRFSIAASLLFVAPAIGMAQKTGTVRILVVDDETGDPVQGATLKAKNRETMYTTDQRGMVHLDSLPAGKVQVQIRAIGFMPRDDYLNVQADQVSDRRFGLAFSGEKLPELVVSSRREKLSGRYQDFHRRMAAGSGFFLMWDEIQRKGYSRLGDALRTVRGVHMECRVHNCVIQMARSDNCPPAAVFVDGRPSDYFGPNTPIGDVYGIEVYRGAGEMPGEFVGTGGCGAVAIWTKNRPYK